MKILVADIGGTNSRFASFSIDAKRRLTCLESLWLNTKDFSSFGHLIGSLKNSTFSLLPEESDIAVIAVAGPVLHEVLSSPPLISWDIDISNAKNDFGFKSCFLINDFVAQAFACRTIIGDTAEEVLPGEKYPDETAIVIGAGTGLGKAAIIPNKAGGFTAAPSEGAHANFPFVSKEECEFQEFLIQEVGEEYITTNHVVSGRGLSYIHKFLTGESVDPQEVTSRFPKNPVVLEWSARFYGRVCRNYALETVSLGGVYVAGGIAAKAPLLIKHKAFEMEFRCSATLGALLKKIPVYLINNEESGLWGAAFFGLQLLNRKNGLGTL